MILIRHLCNLSRQQHPVGSLKLILTMSKSIFCLDILSNQNQKCSDKHQVWSENVRCPTTISSTGYNILKRLFTYLWAIVITVLCLNYVRMVSKMADDIRRSTLAVTSSRQTIYIITDALKFLYTDKHVHHLRFSKQSCRQAKHLLFTNRECLSPLMDLSLQTTYRNDSGPRSQVIRLFHNTTPSTYQVARQHCPCDIFLLHSRSARHHATKYTHHILQYN